MAISSYEVNPELGKVPCKTTRESWKCPNMKDRVGDLDMSGDHYDCEVCGRHMFLDYDEMK